MGAETDVAPARTRLKELIALEGVRENQLVGYGLVVGLAGAGDKRQTVFSAQTLSNMLERMGVSVPPTALQAKNTAAVMVTATLGPFAQAGTRIDTTVAAMGDATTLQGGLLIMTPLKGANGQVYAVAQGPVVTGGFVAGRGGGNNQTVNHPTTGRIPNGAIVELSPPMTLASDHFRLQLKRSDFSNASRITHTINRQFAGNDGDVARAENPSLVVVDVPPAYKHRPVEFLAHLESLAIDVDRMAKIVINERTGTIAMGKEVRIGPVSILHGNLTVEVETSFAVSQPPALSGGETAVVPQIGVGVKEEKARHLDLKEGATVEELVRALMAIGSTPRDVIAILQNLQAAGALDAEIEVI
ncbi:MAG: flagellar basal body P-ring protein FlgI [Acidimicrobiia bacterium]|nr:flagellar basal body P-ring protein FlgI [Acidimicrobiia bacterium]